MLNLFGFLAKSVESRLECGPCEAFCCKTKKHVQSGSGRRNAGSQPFPADLAGQAVRLLGLPQASPHVDPLSYSSPQTNKKLSGPSRPSHKTLLPKNPNPIYIGYQVPSTTPAMLYRGVLRATSGPLASGRLAPRSFRVGTVTGRDITTKIQSCCAASARASPTAPRTVRFVPIGCQPQLQQPMFSFPLALKDRQADKFTI